MILEGRNLQAIKMSCKRLVHGEFTTLDFERLRICGVWSLRKSHVGSSQSEPSP